MGKRKYQAVHTATTMKASKSKRLRDIWSIINRFDTQEAHLVQLKTLAEEYYRANALFLPTSVNPTIWTIGHVLPVHAKQVFNKYKQGLFTVTMEGRGLSISLYKNSVSTLHTRKDGMKFPGMNSSC